jgi:hypothetical protein
MTIHDVRQHHREFDLDTNGFTFTKLAPKQRVNSSSAEEQIRQDYYPGLEELAENLYAAQHARSQLIDDVLKSLTMTGPARLLPSSSITSFEHTRPCPTKAKLTLTVAGKTYLPIIHTSTTAATLLSSKVPSRNSTCLLESSRYTAQAHITRTSVPGGLSRRYARIL